MNIAHTILALLISVLFSFPAIAEVTNIVSQLTGQLKYRKGGCVDDLPLVLCKRKITHVEILSTNVLFRNFEFTSEVINSKPQIFKRNVQYLNCGDKEPLNERFSQTITSRVGIKHQITRGVTLRQALSATLPLGSKASKIQTGFRSELTFNTSTTEIFDHTSENKKTWDSTVSIDPNTLLLITASRVETGERWPFQGTAIIAGGRVNVFYYRPGYRSIVGQYIPAVTGLVQEFDLLSSVLNPGIEYPVQGYVDNIVVSDEKISRIDFRVDDDNERCPTDANGRNVAHTFSEALGLTKSDTSDSVDQSIVITWGNRGEICEISPCDRPLNGRRNYCDWACDEFDDEWNCITTSCSQCRSEPDAQCDRPPE